MARLAGALSLVASLCAVGSAQITFSTLPDDLDAACNFIPEAQSLVATSTCGGAVDVEFVESRTNQTCTHAYDLVRTWTATDLCGATLTHRQVVRVTDVQAPIITGVPPDRTIRVGEPYPTLNVDVVDFCDEDPVLETVRDSVPGACGGYALVYRYTGRDACGNQRTARFVLNVNNDEPPIIRGVGAGATLACGEELPAAPNVTASDNAGTPQLILRVDTTFAHGGDTCKVVSRVWTATDICGLTTSATQRFAFLDGTGPVLVGVPADTIIYCEALPIAPVVNLDVTATDDCGAAPVITYEERSEQTNNGTCSDRIYRVLRTWRAVDDCGNVTEATQVLEMKCECCSNGVDDDDDGLVDDYDPQCNCFAGVEAACDSLKRYYIPPVLQQPGGQFNRPSELVITTLAPEANIFIETADGTSYSQAFVVQQGTPLRIPLTIDQIMTVGHDKIERDKGFVITSDQLIQPIYRIDSRYNKVLVTIKGPQALGRVFRAASQTYTCGDNSKDWGEGHFISVMATEDDTEVTIDFKFPAQGGLKGPVTRRLNKHETYLIRDDKQNTTVSGSLITATKPIAVLTGSQHTRHCQLPLDGDKISPGQDGGIDQLVPNCLTGDEYVMVRGKGAPVQQYAILVANKNNTRVIVDGDVNNELILEAGDYTQVWLDGGPYAPKHFKGNKPFYAFQVAGISENNEVGMAICGPVGECKGDTLIEFPKFENSPTGKAPDNSVYVISRTADLPTLQINGANYSSCATATPVPSRPDLSVVTFEDACLNSTNAIRSGGRFTAGMLVGIFKESGTHGYLTSFKDRMEVRHPRTREVTTAYFVDTLCGSTTASHCIDVSSCATAHSIAAATAAHGTVTLDGGSCFTYTPSDDYQGMDEALVTLQNDQGLFQTVCLSFFVCNSPPDVAFPFIDTTVSCEAIPPLEPPTTSDECDMRVEYESEELIDDGACDYAYLIERHWIFWDECGDSTRATQRITVVDTSAPIALDVPSDTIVAGCNGVPPLPTVTFDENCDNDFQYTFEQVTVDSSCVYDYTVVRTWTAWDICGNRSTATQRIELRDTAAPLFVGLPDDLILGCGDPVPAAAVDAMDDCDPNPVIALEEINLPTTCDTLLHVIRRWTATDACGRTAEATQRILRLDLDPAVLTDVPADTTILCDAPLPTAAPMVSGGCVAPGAIAAVDSVVAGTCPVIERVYRTWTTADACGNVLTARQVISVVDTAAPRFIPLPDTIFTSCVDSVVVEEPTVVEACDFDLTYTDSIAVVAGCNGERLLFRTYRAEDRCERVATYRQLYYFRDTIAPIWQSEPADTLLNCGDSIPPAIDPSFVDACSGLNPISLTVRDSSRVCPAARFIIRDYTISDWCGNLSYFRQVITVVGCEPVIPVLAAGQASCLGSELVLTVRVDSGYTTPVYQWEVDRGAGFVPLGTPLTDREYRIAGADPSYDGDYRVNVANSVADLGRPECSSFSNVFPIVVRPPVTNEVTLRGCAGDTLFYLGDALTADTVRTDTLVTTYGCDSVVTLTSLVDAFVEISLDTTLCFGESLNFRGRTFDSSGTYRDTVVTAVGCDTALAVRLEVLPDYRDTTFAGVCDGDAYAFGDSTYATPGTYRRDLTSGGGCDSSEVLVLRRLDTAATAIDTVVCPGGGVTVGSERIDVSGDYVRVLQTADGCDSTVRLRLTVLTADTTEIASALCDGEVYFFGDERLREAGTYLRTTTSSRGCDSTIRLRLRASPRYDTEVRAELCEGEIYRNGSYSIAAPGRWPLQFYTADGCDSIVYATVVFRKPTAADLDVTLCRGESYALFDTTLATAGTYVRTGRNQFGCDSVVTLQLDFEDPSRTVVREELCYGDVLRAAGRTFVTDTRDSFVLASRLGCDSLVVVDVRFRDNNQTTDQAAICAGDSLLYGTTYLREEGTYAMVLTDQYGCDSTALLELTVRDTALTELDAEICPGDSYVVGTDSFSTAGRHVVALQTALGCDSTVVLDLAVRPPADTTWAQTICTGDSLQVFDTLLTTAGRHVVVGESARGCDSTVTLDLRVAPVYDTLVERELCFGDTVRFGDLVYARSVTDTVTYASVDACDSVVVYRIAVLPETRTRDTVNICSGGGLDVGGEWVTQAGDYPAVYASANGCDSTHVVTLVVHDNVTLYDTVRICHSDSVAFDGGFLREAGTYVAEYESYWRCDSTVVLELVVEGPIRLAVDDASVCAGTGVALEARGYDGPIRWTPSEGLSCVTCPRPVATPLATTTYTASATACDGEVVSATATVAVRQPVDVKIVSKRKLRLGESARLVAVADDPNAHMQWREGDRVLCDACDEVVVQPVVTTVYEVEARTEEAGCDDTERFTLIVEDACSFADIEIPNVITPNGDGANDLFEIRYAGVKEIVLLRVYNRWGEVVYETTDIDQFWDGTHRGMPLNPGVFVYYLEGYCLNDEPFAEEGNVTLVR